MVKDVEAFVLEMDREMSKKSFRYFFVDIMGMLYSGHHETWDKGLEGNQYYCVKASRDHGKSVFMHSWVVWKLCFQPAPYQMLYISSNQKQTMVHMRDIDKMFTHPMLKQFKPARGWAIGNIQLTNGNAILEIFTTISLIF